MKSAIFAVMCAAVGAMACGGSGGSSVDAGFSGGDPHARVTCSTDWHDTSVITTCEAACQHYEVETGPSCASITGHTGGICSKTFDVDGMYGCCDLEPDGSGSGGTERLFYVCP